MNARRVSAHVTIEDTERRRFCVQDEFRSSDILRSEKYGDRIRRRVADGADYVGSWEYAVSYRFWVLKKERCR